MQRSGTGREAGGTKRDSERAPSSLGRREDDAVFGSFANVGAAATVNRNRLEGLRTSDGLQRCPAALRQAIRRTSLARTPFLQLSRALSLGHSLPLNVRAASLSTMLEMNF
ncbi:hypothetical protein VIGAN_06160400, partial [Vigna angularis var. angularis]